VKLHAGSSITDHEHSMHGRYAPAAAAAAATAAAAVAAAAVAAAALTWRDVLAELVHVSAALSSQDDVVVEV
jgi:hypothetical protein